MRLRYPDERELHRRATRPMEEQPLLVGEFPNSRSFLGQSMSFEQSYLLLPSFVHFDEHVNDSIFFDGCVRLSCYISPPLASIEPPD